MPSNVVPLRRRAPDDRRARLDAAVRVDFIRGIRRRGWTVEQTARECCVSPDAVCLWISGKRRIPATAYAVVLGIVTANDNGRKAA